MLAHGLEGTPQGRKPTALRAAGVPLVCPDMQGMVLAQRAVALEAAVRAHPGCVLVGSSYGGLASMAVLADVRAFVAELVLLAPALHWSEPPVADADALTVPPDLPAWVVHGVDDTIVPIDVSERLVARCPHVVLERVDDDHLLKRTLPRIVEGIVERASR